MLIRHGKTLGNEKKLFVGRLDEDLSLNGRDEISALKKKAVYTNHNIVYSSPLKRCIQTAGIIFENTELIIIDDLREMDFGIFDGKSFEEITLDMGYADFGSCEEKMYFPQGELVSEFKKRCISAFEAIIKNNKSCAVVCHGGVIMAVMEWLSNGRMSFYDAMSKNGGGYKIIINENEISYFKF